MKLTTRLFVFRRWAAGALATRQPITRKTKIILASAIFLGAFAVRSLHAVDLAPSTYTADQPFNGLTQGYDLRAVSILNGEGLLGPYNIDPSYTRWLSHVPGYSIFLSAIYKVFGRDFFRVQLVQNLITSAAAVLILLIAASLLGWKVGVVSGVLAAVSHHFGHISNFILPDPVTAVPVLVAIYVLVKARKVKSGWWMYIAAGLMIGAATWLRAQTLLLGIFVCVFLTLISTRRLRAFKRGAVIAAFSLIAIAPITIRNYVVYGEFVPLSMGLGITLWAGIGNAGGERFGAVKFDTEVATQDAEIYGDARYAGSWATPDGIKRDRDRTRRSIEVIRNNPMWYAGVMLDRCRDMVKYSAHAPLMLKAGQADSAPQTRLILREWREMPAGNSNLPIGKSLIVLRPALRPLQRLTKETMQVFILVGAFAAFTLSRRRGLWIGMVPAYYFIFQSLTHTEFRYTLPMQYFLFVFAATTWVLLGAVIWSATRRLFRRSPKQASNEVINNLE